MDDKTLAKAVGRAVRATGSDLDQHTPKDEDLCGRSTAARLIKMAQRMPSDALSTNGVAKTEAERREERLHTARAEAAATGGRGAGDVLRKGGERTALDAIKSDIATARLRDLLQQAVTVASRRMRKNAADDIVTQGSRRATVTTPRYPPQSRNGQWDDVRAKDGAQSANDVQDDERQKAGVREKPTPYRGTGAVPHDSSIYQNGSRLPEGQEDGTDNYRHDTVEAIKRALQPENARPYAPGALGGREKDPNRFDSF